MAFVSQLVGFGLRQVLGGSAETAISILGGAADQVAKTVVGYYTDHSCALPRALARANDRAWQVLAVALTGDGWFDSIKVSLTASGDARGFREEVRRLLEGTPAEFRGQCLAELKEALRANLLSADELDSQVVARQAADTRRYADTPGLIDGACLVIAAIADELAPCCPNLAKLLRQRPAGGPPLVVAAFAYFVRREIETNAELARGLTFDGLRQLAASQETAFGVINDNLTALGDRFDQSLDDATAELKTHISAEMKVLQGTIEKLGTAFRAVVPLQHLGFRKENFHGRAREIEDLLAQLRAARAAGRALNVLCLKGMGGVGKSALAAELAESLRQDENALPGGVLWANLLEKDPADVARRWTLDLGGDPTGLDGEQCVQRFRERAAACRLLVVLDNAQDRSAVDRLLVKAAGVTTIITTRFKEVLPEGVPVHDVDVLTLPDAVVLLRSHIGSALDDDHAAAACILEACGRLPLFLNLAGRAVANNYYTLAGYAEELRQETLILPSLVIVPVIRQPISPSLSCW